MAGLSLRDSARSSEIRVELLLEIFTGERDVWDTMHSLHPPWMDEECSVINRKYGCDSGWRSCSENISCQHCHKKSVKETLEKVEADDSERLEVWRDRVFSLNVPRTLLRTVQTRRNRTPQRVPGENNYNSKDVSKRRPAAAACGLRVDFESQLVAAVHAVTAGKTSSEPQHSRAAGDELGLRHIFLTFIAPKSDGSWQWKHRGGSRFKGSKIKRKADWNTQLLKRHRRRPQAKEGGGGSKCDVTPFHLITFGHVKPRRQERFVTDPLLDWPLCSSDQCWPCRVY